MATETQNASGWVSVVRAGDAGADWSGIPTALGAIDSNYVSGPAAYGVTVGADDYERPCPSRTLRVTFGAFALPPEHIVTSAIVTARHKWLVSIGPDPSCSLTCENSGTALTTTFVNQTIDVTGVSVAALNAGTFTYDLNYLGAGPDLLIPLDDDPPFVAVDFVQLAIETAAPVWVDSSTLGGIAHIPEIGIL